MAVPLFVSVIVPVHNGAPFLTQAVAGILNQKHHPLEIIIVNDGSTDDTAAVAARLEAEAPAQIHVVSQPQAGPAAARNRGLALARGDIIGFLDADDLWTQDSLAHRLAPLGECATLSVVVGRSRLLRMSEAHVNDGAPLPPDDVPEEPGASEASFLSPLLGSALFRRSAFGAVGGFDPALRYGEDVDWFLRAREHGLSLATILPTTLLYRRHSANMTRGKSMTDLNVMAVLKLSLDRRRRQSGTAGPLPDIRHHAGETP